MQALCRCVQTWTVPREFVRPGWTCLLREMVDTGIIASAFALAHLLVIALAVEISTDAIYIGKTIHPRPTRCESAGMAVDHAELVTVPRVKKGALRLGVLMKSGLLTFVFCSMLAFGTRADTGAQIDVRYIAPERFSDLKNTWLSREDLLASLTAHLQKLGQKYLPEGQRLQIEISDIDLAGSIEYPHNAEPVRVMRQFTPPSIALQWHLQSAEGDSPMHEVTLRDFDYQMNSNEYSQGDPLRYEKQMLDGWFKRSFAAKAK